METTKPNDFLPLLEVFRLGLSKGIVQKNDVIQWADKIINDTDAPDYFFIELSLGNNANNLIEIIGQYVKPPYGPICYRVLLALIYHRHPIQNVTEVEKVAILVGSISSWDILTSFETDTIYMFDDYDIYYLPDLTQLQVELINFLSIYEAFTLENYEQWADINGKVLELVNEEAIKAEIVNRSIRKTWTKKARNEKLKRYIKGFAGIFIISLFVIVLANEDDGNSTFPVYYFLVIFFFARMAYSWWRRKPG